MQKAILVGVNLNENLDFDHSMEELENLAEACEIEAAAQVVQNLPMVNNAFYIGTGKVEEVKNLVSMLDADCVIFDNSLTPSQQRNLQNQLEVPVWDRTNLILEILTGALGQKKPVCRSKVRIFSIFCRVWSECGMRFPDRAAAPERAAVPVPAVVFPTRVPVKRSWSSTAEGLKSVSAS